MKGRNFEPNEPVISQREVERRYQVLIKDVETKDFYKSVDLTNRVNCYSCATCGHITKTKDVDAGVTPMFFDCEKCGKQASSSFFRDIAPNQQPTIEWYRPSLKEVIGFRKKQFLLDHVLGGGLHFRKINT